jgi:hypothetical protein
MPLADRAVEWDLSGGTAGSSADPRDLAIQWHSDGRSNIVLRITALVGGRRTLQSACLRLPGYFFKFFSQSAFYN